MDKPFRVQIINNALRWPSYLKENGKVIEYDSYEAAADVSEMVGRATGSFYIVVDLREQQ